MIKNIETAIKAINKWVFFGWNYSCVPHEWVGANGEKKSEYVPEFLKEIKWNCNFDHMVSKWHLATRDKNADSYLVKFYAELSAYNRKLLLEWVVRNYNGEQKICAESNEQERSESQVLSEIREWAEDVPYYLCNREGYPRGYRDGMIRAHRMLMSIITGEPLMD